MRTNSVLLVAILLVAVAVFATAGPSDSDYQIGTAMTDVTGPAAETGMMGYAMFNQRTKGVHFRLFARAYIIKHKLSGKTVVYVNMDLCMTMQAVKLQVVENLKSYYPALAKLYTVENILISSTHTHAGPGGYSWYTLYDISTFGWDKKHFYTIVNGIVEAIKQAHDNLSQGGTIKINTGYLFNSNINRSPSSYLLNPEEERKKYAFEGDTDKVMTVMRLEDEKGTELGAIAWFAVHCVSMSNTNLLISGDNKGYASYLWEKYKNKGALPGRGHFVAAFGQTNEGDVSPNTRGTSCPNGSPCAPDSTCDGRTQGCTGKGPGKDEFESTQIIGQNQFEAALGLYNNATQIVSGPIDFRHTFLEIDNLIVQPNYTSTGKQERTCRAAMGFSFAAGTTDGPGDFDFHQGMNKSGNPFWDFVKNFLKKPSEDQIKCQYPKPILLDVGEIEPIPWTPKILPIQLVVIGNNLVIVGVPAEFTTMSGRRMKERIKKTLVSLGRIPESALIVIGGLANAYSGYVATYEEFLAQRYEAASCMYGPHAQAAYVQEMDKLAYAIGHNIAVNPGPNPQNLTSHQHTYAPGVIFDSHPIGSSFGAVRTNVKSSYTKGEVVSVEFWGAHLKNDYMTGRSFLTVEQQQQDGSWNVVRVDADWDTRFHWDRHLISESIVRVEWYTEKASPSGTFRIKTFGASKSITGTITPYEGTSATFTLA